MLGAHDSLPQAPRRVIVAGVSGVGKTTFGRRLALATGIRFTEIDGLFYGPEWTPRHDFLVDVHAIAESHAWITEWQYSSARPLLAARADLLVWLDLPFRVTLWRVVRRTIRRRITREELWNGNREGSLLAAVSNRDGIIRWSIATRRKYLTRIPDAAAQHPHLVIVRLQSSREVDTWLSVALARAVSPG